MLFNPSPSDPPGGGPPGGPRGPTHLEEIFIFFERQLQLSPFANCRPQIVQDVESVEFGTPILILFSDLPLYK
jgi:hypothetical protein